MRRAKEHVSFRLSTDLLERLERYRGLLEQRASVGIDRAKVLRLLIERGLEVVESDGGK
jgi:predicted DNA-binding protein